jgi:hypothetical protein
MSVKILIRRGTAAQWTAANPILAPGEFGYETDTKKLKIGDGSTVWTSLAYVGAEDVIPASAITARGQLITGSDTADYAVLSIGSAGTFLVEDPVAGTLAYQGIALNDLSDASTSGAVTNDLFARGSSQWEKQSFSTALTPSEETVRSVLANGDPRIGVAGYFNQSTKSDYSESADVFKLSFPTDVASTTTSGPLSMQYNAGFANPGVAGYFSRGRNSTAVYKWAFVADAVSTTTAAPDILFAHGGFANPSVAGYFNRGAFNAPVYKWAFPADTVSTTTAASATLSSNAGFSNFAVAGYFNRGSSGTPVYKWAFPSDTVSASTASPATMSDHGGFANPGVAGYFNRAGSTTNVYKWSFPSDTVTTTTATPAANAYNDGFSNSFVAGYINRGYDNTTFVYVSTIYKLSFPTDGMSTTTSAPGSIGDNAGFANG